uniref:Secreted protein n=1 Tax=Panagrellus redivivus TaxID=6233 RepID=A0A7E4V575_PANRE
MKFFTCLLVVALAVACLAGNHSHPASSASPSDVVPLFNAAGQLEQADLQVPRAKRGANCNHSTPIPSISP